MRQRVIERLKRAGLGCVQHSDGVLVSGVFKVPDVLVDAFLSAGQERYLDRYLDDVASDYRRDGARSVVWRVFTLPAPVPLVYEPPGPSVGVVELYGEQPSLSDVDDSDDPLVWPDGEPEPVGWGVVEPVEEPVVEPLPDPEPSPGPGPGEGGGGV